MSADEYTPTADEVADGYTGMRAAERRYESPAARLTAGVEALAEFDRWLAAHDAEVREAAAQEVEAEVLTETDGSPTAKAHNQGIRWAARIIRGGAR